MPSFLDNNRCIENHYYFKDIDSSRTESGYLCRQSNDCSFIPLVVVLSFCTIALAFYEELLPSECHQSDNATNILGVLNYFLASDLYSSKITHEITDKLRGLICCGCSLFGSVVLPRLSIIRTLRCVTFCLMHSSF